MKNEEKIEKKEMDDFNVSWRVKPKKRQRRNKKKENQFRK